MTYVPNELLGRLVGRELNEVSFCAGHVGFAFDGDPGAPGDIHLNCDVWPVVEFGGVAYREPDLGYADALRHLVLREVAATTEVDGSGLLISFDAGSIQINPTIQELEGPEIAMLSGFDDRSWMVWRPGEDSFGGLN